MGKRHHRRNKADDALMTPQVVAGLLSFVILAGLSLNAPRLYGDGNEYFLTVESLINHGTPDLRVEDVGGFYGEYVDTRSNRTVILNLFGYPIPPTRGYVKAPGGGWYSMHFWAYPLAAVPARLALGLLGADVRLSLSITNGILYCLLLFAIAFMSGLDSRQKTALMLLLTFSPAFFFLSWTHAETFIMAFTTLALVRMHAKDSSSAAVFSSVASLQNQSFIVLTAYLWIKCAFEKRRSLGLLALSLAIAVLPSAFYLAVLGTPTPLSGATAASNASAYRVMELFLDPNLGLLAYMPLTVALFAIVLASSVRRDSTGSVEAHLALVMFLIGLVCSTTYNWNSGTTGPSRYAVLMIPFIAVSISKNIGKAPDRLASWAVFACVLSNTLVVASFGFFYPPDAYITHTSAARFILDRLPSAYNPSQEIFCERTLKNEFPCENPTVYGSGGQCKKALTGCDGIAKLQQLCGRIPPQALEHCRNNPGSGLFYVNY
jgi:hypothetical protein